MKNVIILYGMEVAPDLFSFSLLILLLGIIVIFLLLWFFGESKNRWDVSEYKRKPYLFDTTSEFKLYKILLELFEDKYYIFPQVNYSHLIKPKKDTWAKERGRLSRIDRKSADFVLCDKVQIIPQLVIELDGSAHSLKRKQIRDKFIDELLKAVQLPILHLTTDNIDKEFIKHEIEKKNVS